MHNNYSLKKSLVFGIFILFIGAGVIPGISGDIGKTLDQSIKKNTANFSNDDYVNAYWKFNEGNGNTAGDSSGHNYDGTIYGATWTSDTPSGYGYALDFDGVNDYVDLDTHSNKLGFNKTDDLIFSLYFNSSSTNSGYIYSSSYHWEGHYPEVHIELTSNGNLKIQVWVGDCGISLISKDTYNDDDWHFAEIYYNGITADPTVKIYVDGDLDCNITDWVCSFSADEFTRTKIGRKARNATGYFDGKIDELKIIKYPGGNRQAPPNISGPIAGDPGVKYDFTFVTDDPEKDNIQLYIDWNDNTTEDWGPYYDSGEEVIVSHEWNEEGKYRIRAKSRDIWGDSISSYHTIRIGNQPPYAPNISGPQFGDPEIEYNYIFITEDHENENVCYFIDWGDGETEWTDYYASGEEITVSHSWDSEDVYEITTKAKDIHDNEGDLSDPFLVSIGDKPPNVPKILGPTSGNAGTSYDYIITSSDSDGDDISYYIEWGDGDIINWTAFQNSGTSFFTNHTWISQGKYTIKTKAKDTYGAESDWGYLKVTMPKIKNVWHIGWFDRFPLVQKLLDVLRLYTR